MPTRRLISTGYRKYEPNNRFSFNRLLILSIFVTIMLATGLHSGFSARSFEKVQIINVLDGDTVVISDANGDEVTIRLLGIDTPETHHPNKPVQCYGQEASNFAKSQLQDQVVELEYDIQKTDKYERTLAYVYLKGKRFNDVLVEHGYATILNIEPNNKYAHELFSKELDARERKLGLWGQCE